METKSLDTDPAHYAKVFKIFCARSTKLKAESDLINGIFSEEVVGKLQVTLDEQEELRVLGVGSGAGENDCVMLEQLLKKFPRINNHVVEPVKELIDQYKSLVQSLAHQLHGVKCDFQQQTIEQYQKAGDSTKFHFISSVHSIYHIAGDVDGGLMNLYDRLEPGGVLLVMINSDEICPLFGILQSGLGDGSHVNFVTSADIQKCLDCRGISYVLHHYSFGLDITQCFDKTSEEGGLLLDFITDVVRFRETAPEELQRSVVEQQKSCSEKRNDAIFSQWHCDALVIHKPVGV